MDKLKGFKTIIFNAALIAIFALNQVGAFGAEHPAPTADVVDATLNAGLESVDKILGLIGAIGNAVLRFGANTTVFKKTSPAPMPEPK